MRWYFLLGSVAIGLAILFQVAVAPISMPMRLLAILADALLCWRSVRLYRHGAGSVLWDPSEAVLLFVISITIGLTGTIALFYTTLCSRVMYPSLPRTAGRMLVYGISTVAAIVFKEAHPSIIASQISGQLFGVVVGSVIIHLMAQALVAQEQAVQREQALRVAGALLLTATDRQELYAAAHAAYAALLATNPQTQVILAVRAGPSFVRVTGAGHSAALDHDRTLVLDALPVALYEDLVADRPIRVQGTAAGAVGAALGLTLPIGTVVITPLVAHDLLMGMIILAHPTDFPRATQAVLDVLTSQVLLALKSMGLTEDLLLRRGEERLSALVQHASDLILVVDSQGALSYISPSVSPLLGYAPEILVGTTVQGLLHSDDQAQLQYRYQATGDQARPGGASEIRVRHLDGTWRFMEANYTDLRADPRVAGIVINARDITERKRFEEQLRHQAFHDPLTALPNRALFLDRVERALARTVRRQTLATVLLLDLDRFKW